MPTAVERRLAAALRQAEKELAELRPRIEPQDRLEWLAGALLNAEPPVVLVLPISSDHATELCGALDADTPFDDVDEALDAVARAQREDR